MSTSRICLYFFLLFLTAICGDDLHTRRKLVCFRGPFLHQRSLSEGFFLKATFLTSIAFANPRLIRTWSLIICVCSSERRTKSWGAFEYNRNLPSVWTSAASTNPRSILDRLCLQFGGKNRSSSALEYNQSLPSVWTFADPRLILDCL